jgi:hypothetical protein
MIIVEVDGEFERLDAVLGKHSWNEVLLAPTEEEVDKSSEVFFCTYNTHKAIKDGGKWVRSLILIDGGPLHVDRHRRSSTGWNRVEIEEYWFQGWRPDNE